MSSLDGGSTDDEDLPEARLVRVEPNGSVDWTSSTLRDVSCFIASLRRSVFWRVCA